jgi:hypothetical protein
MLHKDTVVQLTRDVQSRGVLIAKGSAGRVLSRLRLRHACMVEFTIERRTVIARVDDHDLADVRPNARV